MMRFLLGEFCLFRTRLELLTLEEHFTRLGGDPDAAAPARKEVERDSAGLLMRSHPVTGKVGRLRWRAGWLRYVPSQYQRYYVKIAGSFEDYLAKFKSKTRNTLKRKVKRFARADGGRIRWREFARPEEMEEFQNLVEKLSGKTYQARLLDAGLPATRQFRQQMTELAMRDRVRGYILWMGDKPAAYLYCSITADGVALYDYVGYDPEHGEWSPGTVLQYLALERMFEQGRLRMFDLTEGEGAHKEMFATGSQRCADVYYLRPGLRNICLVGLHTALHAASRACVWTLEALRMKKLLKKLIRSRAGSS